MNPHPLVTAVASLSRTATEDFTVADMLRALSEAATTAPDVDGAGVLRRLDGRNVFVHSSGSYAIGLRPLERLKEALQAGPLTARSQPCIRAVPDADPGRHGIRTGWSRIFDGYEW